MAEAPPGRRAQFDYGGGGDQYGREQYPPNTYPPIGDYPQNGYPRDQYGQDQYTQEQYARDQFDYPREQPPPMQAPPAREQFEYPRSGSSRKPKQRRRRKGLWILLAIVVLLGGGAAAGVALGIPQLVLGNSNVPKAVGLVDAPGAQPRRGVGTADGNWNILRGNTTFVGYRVREKFASVPAPNDAVGRSPAVTGGMSIVGGQVVGAQITADMRQLASDKQRRDGVIRGRGLETNRFPQAVFQLSQPVNLGQLSLGRVTTLNAVGTMTLHGVTRQVRWPLQGRWDGNTIQVAGNIPIRFADYRIQAPSVGGLVSVQPQGQMEFSLVMRRS